ncbi:hypothetical protein GCM10022224_076260 [Nonomuraea antimicrobica]|uniref:Secreted protein n=1 Tax=Nonomuraea antimicrobica TaxID=561173 RepID=A0ABP7D0M3_9ACTN
MHFTPRRIVTAALVACGLTLLTAPAAHAVLDPVHTLTCLAGAPADVTALVDPATLLAEPTALTAPEVPATHCLAP